LLVSQLYCNRWDTDLRSQFQRYRRDAFVYLISNYARVAGNVKNKLHEFFLRFRRAWLNAQILFYSLKLSSRFGVIITYQNNILPPASCRGCPHGTGSSFRRHRIQYRPLRFFLIFSGLSAVKAQDLDG
jgi:hypothetical protein